MAQQRRQPSPDKLREMELMANRQRAALRSFAQQAGFDSMAEWARAAGLNTANSLYNFLAGRADFLATSTLEKLRAAVPGATISQMLGETPLLHPRIRILPCKAEAKAGVWRPTFDLDVPSHVEIPIPSIPGLVADEVVRLADGHADEVYRTGSYLCIEHLANLQRELEPSDRVIVTRARGGKIEITVREVAPAPGGGLQLVMRSSDLRHSARIGMPTPYRGEFWEVDGDRFQVRGRICMASTLEAPDLKGP